jgi:hypothetical protein
MVNQTKHRADSPSTGNARPSRSGTNKDGAAKQDKDSRSASRGKTGEEPKATAKDRTKRLEKVADRDGTGIEEIPAVVRAEELMDLAGERFGHLLLIGGQGLRRGLALAREAADDFWAEAESIRRGERSNSDKA